MKKTFQISAALFFLLVLTSCASKRPYYKEGNGLDQQFPKEKIDYELYLVGDIGVPSNSLGPDALIAMIKDQLSPDIDHQSVVFLGNSLPASGLPDEDSKAYNSLTSSLGKSINALTNTTAQVFFLPGNHEWSDGNEYTKAGVRASEKFIESLANEKNIFKPSKGCGEPKVVTLTDDLIMVLVDSQWLVQSDDSNERKKSGCDIDNNLEFVTFMEELIARNKQKNIVFAMHHPIYSNGLVGGNYPIKNHLLPLPVVGSLATGVRKLMGRPQEFGHPDYESFRAAILLGIQNCEGCITVAGHDNSLQYFLKNDNHYIVAGSGSKVSYVRQGDGAEFSSMSQGFTKLIHTTNLELWLEFYGIDTNTKKLELLYRKRLYKKEILDFKDEKIYKPKEEYAQTIRTKATDIYDDKNRLIRGNFYRKAWGQEIEVPLLWLDETEGGLKPIQQGGGFQTSSLRLENSEGVQFVLRSINKKVEKIVPPGLRKTFVESFIQDGIAASHPYGAFVIPKLAEAAGIYHANPKIVYLSHQEALGDYNPTFAEGLYLFEERPGGEVAAHSDYGGTKKTVNTPKLVEELQKSHKHKVDQSFALRSRIFDFWVGDWDRHEDQWRWGTFKKDGYTLYRPIPRDRDQVFYNNDGLVGYLASRPYFNPTLRRFREDVDFLPGLFFSGRYFDRNFLHQLSKSDFIAMAKELEEKFTDEVIEEAFKDWPLEIQNLNAEKIKKILKVRRSKLPEFAEALFDHIFKEVTVVGTNSKNFFEVEYLEGDKIKVTAYHKKKEADHLIYENTLYGNQTKELRLFGLKKSDNFLIKGNHKSSIKIRVIGGSGEDKIVNESVNKKVLVYDKPASVMVEGPHKPHIKDEVGISRYDREDWKQNRFLHFPMLGFYTDEGVGLTYNVWWKKFGFRSDPFKANHMFSFSFFPQNRALVVNYAGYFPKAAGKWDFELNVLALGPAFTQQYYGLGNTYVDYEEVFPAIEDASNPTFHIVRGTHIDINPGFVRKTGKTSNFKFIPSFEFLNLRATDDDPRFYLLPEAELSPQSFIAKYYGGLRLEWNATRIDNIAVPTRGFNFNAFTDYKLNLNDSEFSNLTFGSNLTTYIPFNQSNTVVLAMNMGGAYTVGDYEFFHANYIGGNSTLRGFRRNRFAGEAIAYHATDLRFKLFRGKGAFPISIGIFGSFDYGRSWYKEEVGEIDRWHTSYGGGLFFTPLNMIGLRVGYFRGAGSDSTLSIGGALAF